MKYSRMGKAMKKSGIILLALILVFLIWYLFIKTNDFEVVMNVRTSPGTVYHNVLGWNEGLNKSKTITVIHKKKPFSKLIHTYSFKSYKLEFNWEMNKMNDSVTKVLVGVNDLDRSLMTRVSKLFGNSPTEKLIHQEFSGFNTELLRHLDQFDVNINGKENSPEAFVAYVNISCHQNEKAAGMINNSTYINTFLKANNMTLLSHPFVEILIFVFL